MFNYDLNQNYHDYNNYNYNQPLYTENENPKSVFDPYSGFIRGNMFTKLYDPYIAEEPIQIRPSSEKEQMLQMLDALDFSLTDINLYLDIYPRDKDMLELFNQYRIELNKICEEYEKRFGPLLINSDAIMNYPWAWDNKPWPWEKN